MVITVVEPQARQLLHTLTLLLNESGAILRKVAPHTPQLRQVIEFRRPTSSGHDVLDFRYASRTKSLWMTSLLYVSTC